MLKNGIVTVFGLADDGEHFVRKGCFEAWVSREARLKTQADGALRCDTFDVRIALSDAAEPEIGDLLFIGESHEPFAEPSHCRKIAAVKRNGFGTSPHWHIRAEYIYR